MGNVVLRNTVFCGMVALGTQLTGEECFCLLGLTHPQRNALGSGSVGRVTAFIITAFVAAGGGEQLSLSIDLHVHCVIFRSLIENGHRAVSAFCEAGVHEITVVYLNGIDTGHGATVISEHKDAAVGTVMYIAAVAAISVGAGRAGDKDHLVAVCIRFAISNGGNLRIGVGVDSGILCNTPAGSKAVIHIVKGFSSVSEEETEVAVLKRYHSGFAAPDVHTGIDSGPIITVRRVEETHCLIAAAIAVNRDDHFAVGGCNTSAGANQTSHLGAVLQIQQLRSAPVCATVGTFC